MNTSTLKTTIRVWLVIMVAGGSLPLQGENGPVRFERIGFAQGLPQSYITVIFQDRRGFLWVGTADGLARYDGYSFITYRYDPLDTTSISDNYIQSIYEDRQGFLWVTTSGGGINRMDPHTGRFVHFRRRRSAPYRLHDNTVTAVVEDRAGNLWIGTAGGLHLVGPDRTYPRLFLPHTGNPGGLRDGHITLLYPDREGNLWIGTRRRGLYRLSAAQVAAAAGPLQDAHAPSEMLPLPFDHYDTAGVAWAAVSRNPPDPIAASPGLPDNYITTLWEDDRGNLWIGTANGLACLEKADLRSPVLRIFPGHPLKSDLLDNGFIRGIYSLPGDERHLWICTGSKALNRLDRETGTVQRFYFTTGNKEPIRIGKVFQDREGNLWVLTENSGLWYGNAARLKNWKGETRSYSGKRNRGAGPFVAYGHDPNDPHSLSDDAVTAVWEDRSGILWVGTRRGGLNKLNRRRNRFRHYAHTPEHAGSLSHNVVTAILEDDQGALWVGTAGGGLNRLFRDHNTGRVLRTRLFRHDPRNPGSLSHDYVTALYRDQSGNLWVGTLGGGLNRYDPESHSFAHYRHRPGIPNSLTGDEINTIFEDQYGQLWIGTNSGLTRFDRFTNTFTRYRHDPDDPHTLSDNEVWAIFEDHYSQGRTLWIGTRSGGLNRFDRSKEQFIRYTRRYDEPHSLSNQAICVIYQDEAGDLWFGTYSGGLNKFHRETEQFTFYTERDGLPNNMIFGILEDNHGMLWLSTNGGLSRFNPRTGVFKNYDIYDGLQANEFTRGAYYKCPHGEMFFGGIHGLTSFYPDSVVDNPHVPPVAITAFSIYGEPAPEKLGAALREGKPLELSYRQNFIAFEFAALDFTNPGKNRYAYKLEGFDADWIYCGTRRYVSYTNLPPGRYTFRVKGANNDGIWNTEGAALTLVVHPPFWRTWWFYLLTGALILGGGILGYRSSVQRKLRRALELERVRAEENERVRTKAAHDFHDELGHKLTRISLFTEILKRRLNDAPAEIQEYLSRIGETAKGLSGGMRDFIWALDPEKDSLYEVAIRLKDFGDELFDKTGIAFRVEGITGEMEHIRLSMDWRRHLTLIFKEAMNNALKHADCSNVTLTIALEQQRLRISLTDDGKGLPPELTRETPLDAENGRLPGNGLRNMQVRAETLRGKLRFHSHGAGGTAVEFSAEIPPSKS